MKGLRGSSGTSSGCLPTSCPSSGHKALRSLRSPPGVAPRQPRGSPTETFPGLLDDGGKEADPRGSEGGSLLCLEGTAATPRGIQLEKIPGGGLAGELGRSRFVKSGDPGQTSQDRRVVRSRRGGARPFHVPRGSAHRGGGAPHGRLCDVTELPEASRGLSFGSQSGAPAANGSGARGAGGGEGRAARLAPVS